MWCCLILFSPLPFPFLSSLEWTWFCSKEYHLPQPFYFFFKKETGFCVSFVGIQSKIVTSFPKFFFFFLKHQWIRPVYDYVYLACCDLSSTRVGVKGIPGKTARKETHSEWFTLESLFAIWSQSCFYFGCSDSSMIIGHSLVCPDCVVLFTAGPQMCELFISFRNSQVCSMNSQFIYVFWLLIVQLLPMFPCSKHVMFNCV